MTEVPPSPPPARGGRYIEDPKTGKRTRVTRPKPAASAPPSPEPDKAAPAETADRPAPKGAKT